LQVLRELNGNIHTAGCKSKAIKTLSQVHHLRLALASSVVSSALGHVGVGTNAAAVVDIGAAAKVLRDTGGHVGIGTDAAGVVLSLAVAVGLGQGTGGQSEGSEEEVDTDHFDGFCEEVGDFEELRFEIEIET